MGYHLSAHQWYLLWDLSITKHLTFHSIFFCSSKFSGLGCATAMVHGMLIDQQQCSIRIITSCNFLVCLLHALSTQGHWLWLFFVVWKKSCFLLPLLFWSMCAWEIKQKVNFYFYVYFCVNHLTDFLLFSTMQYIHWHSSMNSFWWWVLRDTERNGHFFLFVASIAFYLSINWQKFYAELRVDFFRESWERFPVPYSF